MAYPISITRNSYHENRKNSAIQTPFNLCEFIHQLVKDTVPDIAEMTVIDPACGEGRLLGPFKMHVTCGRTIGFDIQDIGNGRYMDIFVQFDFLKTEVRLEKPGEVLFLCNPPFNNSRCTGKKLLPELFAKKIFYLYGVTTPLVLFVPMGFCLNQRWKSSRWRWLRDSGARITGRIALPIDTFPGTLFHQEILLFNINGAQPHYWLPDWVLDRREKPNEIDS